MSGLNKVMIIGRLGHDPELKFTPAGVAVCKLSVATSETWRDKDSGEKQERTEWHKITLWHRLAEIAGEYIHKGSQAYFEGKLQTRAWEDKNGNKRYSTEIVADRMQLLDSKRDSSGTASKEFYGDPPPEKSSPEGDGEIPF